MLELSDEICRFQINESMDLCLCEYNVLYDGLGDEECVITVPYASNGVIEKRVQEGSVNCSWIIETKPNTFIGLEIDYTIESYGGNCTSDYISVRTS